MVSIDTAVIALDYAAVAVFGATGALAAARRNYDIVTFAFFSAVTGVGGGTLRDLLIGAPVFWVQTPAYLVVCAVTAVAAREARAATTAAATRFFIGLLPRRESA